MEWLHNIPSSSKNMFLIFDFKVILFCFCLLYMFKHHIFRWTVLNSKHNTQMFNVFNIFHGIIIRLFSCWRYVVHYFTVFLNVNKERTIWWCHMTSSNWQFWPWNTRHQKSKPKKKKKMQLGSTSNIFVVCQQCCEWSGYAELFTQDTLEVTGEMGVNISVSTLQVSAHFLKVDWIFRKCAGHGKEADVMK